MSKGQEIIDFGWENYLKETDSDLTFVDVGVLPEDGGKKRSDRDGKQTDITMAELASIQEHGAVINVTPKMRGYLGATGLNLKASTREVVIPARPFMRQTFDEQLPELEKMADELEQMTLTKGISRRAALATLGTAHQNQIKKNMKIKGKFAANHPYTIKKKGSSNELIDQGLLRAAIQHKVR